jgi:hypothetical protein
MIGFCAMRFTVVMSMPSTPAVRYSCRNASNGGLRWPPQTRFECAHAVLTYTRSTMAYPNEQLAQKYSRQGHPSVDELAAAQGVTFPWDPRDLVVNFWPEDESIDDFVAAMREWRGHAKIDPAA